MYIATARKLRKGDNLVPITGRKSSNGLVFRKITDITFIEFHSDWYNSYLKISYRDLETGTTKVGSIFPNAMTKGSSGLKEDYDIF